MTDPRTTLDPRLGELRDAIGRLDHGLDDVARARIESKLSAELDRIEAGGSLRSGPRVLHLPRWTVLAAVAAAAAFVAGLLGYALLTRGDRSPIAPPSRAVIAPSLIAGFDPPRALDEALLGARVEQLLVPEGGVVRAELGEDATITLIGPAWLSIASWTAERRELLLESGLLIADVEHRPGRRFIVDIPGASVEVVGTLFAIDARDRAHPVVAVERGAVEVQPAGARVEAGREWRGGEPQAGMTAASDPLARAMREHAAAPRVDVRGAGVLVVTCDPIDIRVAAKNGEDLGKPPIRARLAPGKRALELRREGEAPRAVEAEVRSGSTVVVHVAWPELQPQPNMQPQPKLQPQPNLQPQPSKPAPKVKPLDAETLYRQAEESMRRGDRENAEAQLGELVRRFADDPLADSALYELARSTEARGDRDRARAYLEELLARRGDPTLLEAAHHMLCRIQVAAGDDAKAIECLAAFRRRFPASVHDRAALKALAGLAEKSGGCRAALPWLDELVRSYPDDPLAREAEERARRCED